MTQTYFDPDRIDEPYALPDCEIFYMEDSEARETLGDDIDNDQAYSGWYWWACFPGCLPNGDPSGPYDTYLDALIDARQDNDLYETEMIDSHAESWHYETPGHHLTVWYSWLYRDPAQLFIQRAFSQDIPLNTPINAYIVTFDDVSEDELADWFNGQKRYQPIYYAK